MDSIRSRKLMIRWALISAAATAIFWAVWHLVAGEVPEVASLALAPGWTLPLPLEVSRWWDVPVTALGALVIFTLLTSTTFNSQERFKLVSSLLGGALLGLGLSLGNQFIPAFAGILPLSAFVAALTLSIVMSADIVADNGQSSAGIPSLPIGFGIGAGLTEGMPVGLTLTLSMYVVGTIFLFGTILFWALCDHIAGSNWSNRVKDWLTAEDAKPKE
ncbi:MAG: hypothetical protein AAB562_03755 [Patescibacteria group bacterium]